MSLPIGLTWRPAEPSDAPSIVALQDACFEVDGGYREVEDEILERFDSPMLDPTGDTLLGVDADGAVVVSIWNYMNPEPDAMWKVYDDTYVRPDYRSTQVRDAVLEWWMQRARTRVSASDRKLPIEFHQHVYPESQQEEIAFLEDRGFTPAIYFDELRRDLSVEIPETSLPDDLRLVAFDEVPDEDALAARNAAFADHRGSQPWTLEMWKSRRDSSSNVPAASFAILDGDQPVSYVLCGQYPHDWEDRGYSEGWIEGVGTIRSHRGRGLASVLICATMRVFVDMDLEYATLEVDSENPTGAAGLYAKLGFERVRGFIDYTRVEETGG